MKPTFILGLALAAAIIGAFVSFPNANAKEKAKPEQEAKLYPTIYRTADLPVYTGGKEWRPELLMNFIQSTVFPKSWEGQGGESTMAPYPQNHSIVISTTQRGHARISELMERFRARGAKPSRSE